MRPRLSQPPAKLPRMETDPIAGWRDYLIAAGRPHTTIRLRTYQLQRLQEAHPRLLAVTTEQLTAWLASHDWAAETRRSMRAALRSFYSWAEASELVDRDPTRLLPSIRPAKHPPRPAPPAAVRWALAAGDERVRLMVTLASRQGLRRGEIARVHSDDLGQDLLG